MKRIMITILATAVLMTAMLATAFAEQKAPIKVALTPVLVENSDVYQEEVNIYYMRVQRALHVPLNGYRHVTEEISQTSAISALQNAEVELKGLKQKYQYEDVVKEAAKKIDADLMVVPLIRNAYFYEASFGFGRWDRERYYVGVDVKLFVYTKGTDTCKAYLCTRHDIVDTFSRSILENYIAECADTVIDKSGIYYMVHPAKGAVAGANPSTVTANSNASANTTATPTPAIANPSPATSI